MTVSKPEKTSKLIKKLSLVITIAAFVVFVGRGLYPYVHGPSISVRTLTDGAVLSDPAVTISGKALYTKDLSVSGRSLTLATDGSFDETILLHPGYNVISIIGHDRFGKTSSKTYALVLKDPSDQSVAVTYPPNPTN
ncbi:MAG: Polymorphic outer membrane protein [Patescibacteria group bacterium]|nr:Polymorphic outer membrane protein [Patescibacteria group bacterium]